VPLEHLAQLSVLRSQWPGSHAAALLIDCLERARKTILGRLLAHHGVVLPRFAPDMRTLVRFAGDFVALFASKDDAEPRAVCARQADG
jgi:hypothetical protein